MGDLFGNAKHDPAKHDEPFLSGFMNFLGEKGGLALQMQNGGMAMNMGGSMGVATDLSSMGMNMQVPGAPPAKRQKEFVSTGDPAKDELVLRIKAFQRSGQEQKEQWWT